MAIPAQVIKRDGRIVEFDQFRIENAIHKCLRANREDGLLSGYIANQVVNVVSARYQDAIPTVEQIQDAVEMMLLASGKYEAAKSYILYRAEHAKMREVRPIPEHVRRAFAESEKYFKTPLQQFQFYDKYSRFNYDLGRRETWTETVERAVSFLFELSGGALDSSVYGEICQSILNMQAMPSMRLLAMAGPAARRDNVAIYNCCALGADSVDSFVEALLISMAGCGVGFSVERQYVEQLPRIRRQRNVSPIQWTIEDTAQGWADALRLGLESWFDGYDVVFDYSLIRPAGAPLRTKGGRASGPEPLRVALNFARARILSRQGSVLRSLDAHDLMCVIGNAAISGGVRRMAMISLFDHDDIEMRQCKSGDFEKENSQRWNANNSAVWNHDLTQEEFISHFMEMVTARRGEPGIFSRQNARLTRPTRRGDFSFLTNPCSEVNLRNTQFCNLSIAIARVYDTFASIVEKVRIATIIGTIQSMATHFPGLRDTWRHNCEEERLLGVDITGQMDSPVVQDAGVLAQLKEIAIKTNQEYAGLLGINPSAAITCVKPSGNSSQLLDCSSGLHARHAPYYIRNVRVSAHSPVFKVLRDAGAPMNPENGQAQEDANTWVVHFPVKAPEGAVVRRDMSAVQQCEVWLRNKINWTEHNPSITVTYKSDEILELMQWLWDHKDKIGGMSFLPSDEARYEQMPYVEITQEEYEKLMREFPEVDFSKIYRYEEKDLTTTAQELACVSGACEI